MGKSRGKLYRCNKGGWMQKIKKNVVCQKCGNRTFTYAPHRADYKKKKRPRKLRIIN